MLRFFSPSQISAGFVSILVGYTSAAVIIFQAAQAGGATAEQTGSWLWALGLGMGICSAALSIYYRTPVLIAWSTPGAALLVTSLHGVPMSEAIGAFIFSSALITLCGLTGWFNRIMALVPKSLAAAILAGVLLRFGLAVFPGLEQQLPMVGCMIASYLIGKVLFPRYVIPLTFGFGIAFAALSGQLHFDNVDFALTSPVFVMPTFNINTLISVGIPLFVVTMASQNVPGLATLRAHGYQVPASPLITWSGITGLLLAPFGGFAFNLAAITAAICMGKEVDEDPDKRYISAIYAGFFYMIAGFFAATIVALFTAFPEELVAAIAGLALLSTIGNSLHAAMQDVDHRDAAMMAFAATASGFSLFSIGSAFWGLLLGLVIFGISARQRQRMQEAR